MSEQSEERGDVVVRSAASRPQADEWALVLTAEGLSPEIRHEGGLFRVVVAARRMEAAEAALWAYERENPKRTPAPAPPEPIGPLAQGTAMGAALALLAFFAITGPRDPGVLWFAVGTADAGRMLSGDPWRAVTALTLHADIGHVCSNALFGTLFWSATFAAFGPGLGLLLVVLAGGLGNAANAAVHQAGHLSVGASTAVFGAVGLLGGRAVARRISSLYGPGARLRRWIPVAAGLGIIAMIGIGGERTDLWAHLLGFLAGAAIGLPAGRLWPRPPGALFQWGAGASALAIVAAAWALAWAGGA